MSTQFECRVCGEVKPSESFPFRQIKNRLYREHRCKGCINTRQKELYKQRMQDPEYRERKNARKRNYAQRKRRENPEYRERQNTKMREKHRELVKGSPFVVYAFEILTGEYAGWFYIGQTVCFTRRLYNHKVGHGHKTPELTAALDGIEGVDWSVEFLEERFDKPSTSEAAELERQWILKCIGEDKKLLNTLIPKEAVRLLFKKTSSSYGI